MKSQTALLAGAIGWVAFVCLSVPWQAKADQEKQSKIEAGVGWHAFKLGATRRELIDAFGEPDAESTERYMKWNKDLHINCLIDAKRGAYELRFNKGFDGQLTSGVQIGSETKDLTPTYGQPDSVVERGEGKKYTFTNKGVLFWTKGDKVTQIVVFRSAN